MDSRVHRLSDGQGDQALQDLASYPNSLMIGIHEHHGDVPPSRAWLPEPEVLTERLRHPHADDLRTTPDESSNGRGIAQLCSHPLDPSILRLAAIGGPGPAPDL